MKSGPIYRDIVLAGGGYAHLLFIRRWCMHALPGVRVTLISPLSELPYSGMVPGYLAGLYTHADIHIDVVRLCQRAGVRLLLDEVCGLDVEQQRVMLRHRPALDYDVLSLSTGPAADTTVPGVAEHAIPVKPVAQFLPRWHQVLERVRSNNTVQHIVMTGGGAGAVESLLGIALALRQDKSIAVEPRFTLLTANARLLPDYPARVAHKALKRCQALGITVLCDKRVSRVEAGHLYTADSFSNVLHFDVLLWCGEAAAPEWLQHCGLALDTKGFLRVRDTLQSISNALIFAAGDLAAFEPGALPKAGVYAVRQAPVLFHNLTHSLLQKPLRSYRPQQHFLSLLNLGAGHAAGSYGALSASGSWLARWKASIDRRFMRSFNQLYASTSVQMHAGELVASALSELEINPALRCAGCGGKLGAGTLSAVLREVFGEYQPEDASTTAWPATQLVQSTDLLRAPIDDPWLFGRIATLHALNDLFAMNAQPHSLQLALTLPYAAAAVQTRELRMLVEGVASVCREHDMQLLGGHSAEGEELSLALTVNGTPGEVTFHKQALQAGQLLVLGKPLGTGMVLAAHMQHACPGTVLSAALAVMNSSQGTQARWLYQHGVRCCTDVSGFGLLGHLTEMLGTAASSAASLRIELNLDDIPLLPGVVTLAASGIRSSLFADNELFVLEAGHFAALQQQPLWPLLLDPQTSGGLLAALDPEHKEAALACGFAVIGQVVSRT